MEILPEREGPPFDRLRHLHGQVDAGVDPDVMRAGLREARLEAGEGSADIRASALTDTGALLLRLYERTGDQGDLDHAVELLQNAIAADPGGSVTSAHAASYLGVAMGLRFDRTQDRADLARAVELSNQAITLLDPDDWRAPVYVLNAAIQTARAYDAIGNAQLLDAVTSFLEEAVRVTRPGSAVHLRALGGLAEVLLERADLDASIRYGERRLAFGDAETRSWAKTAQTVIEARRRRYLQDHDVEDLQAAAALRRQLRELGVDEPVAQAPTDSNAAQ